MSVSSVAVPSRRRRGRFGRWGWNVLGIAITIVLIFPVYWMFATAFKPTDDINKLTPTWFPVHPTLQHFRDAIDRPYFWSSVVNSMIIVSVTVAISITLAFLAAVALSKFRFTGREVFIVLLIGIQMLPQVGLIIPLYVVLAKYHLTQDQKVYLGVVITYMTFALPFAVWTLRGFLVNIPKELEEAAMVDGSSRMGAFFRILLPLVVPGLVATSVFVFITSWNEFIFAYVLLSDQSQQTVTVWLSAFYGTSRQVDWGGLMAGSILAAIPVLIFFGFVQRKVAFGLTSGAVKG
jgi:N,N'-diacetylchitobiose transport system permease protein